MNPVEAMCTRFALSPGNFDLTLIATIKNVGEIKSEPTGSMHIPL